MELTATGQAENARVAAGSRFGLVWLAAAAFWLISAATRGILYIHALRLGQVGLADAPTIFIIGALYDVVAALYLFAPFTLYLLFVPRRLFRTRAHRILVWSGFALMLFGFTYLVAVEYFFFDEFNSRFNYVAVQYLIYPHEVFVNIWESYPVARALIASAAASIVILYFMRAPIAAALRAEDRLRARIGPALLVLALLTGVCAGVDSTTGRLEHNRVADELAANGVYAFFSAARTSRLDYDEYYLTLGGDEARARARRLVSQPNAAFIAGAANPLARHIAYGGAPRKLNVIVLLEESLGAEFLGAYGDQRHLTPNLDRLARRSMLFTNVYATGTRTVRGMEAVTASFPPVPGTSIVKRPHNEGMFNWSEVMRKNGYSPTFIYGGYGTFDNMNYFFSHNGYRVIDRTDMDEPKFSNIWGVSDEDLFRNAFAVYDRQIARGERLFSVVMTTSNHKPFTFPAGTPGVPASGGGREAGVRYADYAIGKFVAELKTRPWADDTMLVIVADHGARVYGRADIPMHSYEIPLLVYAPRHVKPERVDVLMSQLDVAPTILGLLNISYDSAFFGKDVLAARADQRRALLNHDRDVALYANGRLNELSFRRLYSTLLYDPRSHRQSPAPTDREGIRDAAAIFQLAYKLYHTGRYRLQ